MSTEWFLHKDGSQYGPYTWEQLCAFAKEGRVQPVDTVWNGALAAWTPAGEVAGLLLQQPPVPEQEEEGVPRPIPGAGGEAFLGYIPAMKKKAGLFSTKTYTLLVTDKRLICAELTNKMLQAAVAQANEMSKGKGVLARMKEAATSQQRIYTRYQNMTPEEILGENPDNFSINNDEVKSIRMRFSQYYDDTGNQQSDQMVIQTTRGKIKLTFHHNNAAGGAKKILWRALGNRVK